MTDSDITLIGIFVTLIGIIVTIILFRLQNKFQNKTAVANKLEKILAYLDRGLFYAGIYKEDPIEMIWAIKETKSTLRAEGALKIGDPTSRIEFGKIIDALDEMEDKVQEKFPNVIRLSQIMDKQKTVIRHEVQEELKDDYWQAVSLMMNLRKDVDKPIKKLNAKLSEMQSKIQ